MTPGRKRVYVVITIAAAALGIAAAGLYAHLSRRVAPMQATVEPVVASAAAPAAPAGSTTTRSAVPTIEAAAERLERRLEEKGGTADDWALLARSYVQMRKYAEAIAAFGHALEQKPGDASLLSEQSAARTAAGASGISR